MTARSILAALLCAILIAALPFTPDSLEDQCSSGTAVTGMSEDMFTSAAISIRRAGPLPPAILSEGAGVAILLEARTKGESLVRMIIRILCLITAGTGTLLYAVFYYASRRAGDKKMEMPGYMHPGRYPPSPMSFSA